MVSQAWEMVANDISSSTAYTRIQPVVAIVAGAVVGLVGWLAMAFSTQVWMAFAINLVVLGFAGALHARRANGAAVAAAQAEAALVRAELQRPAPRAP